MVCLLWSFVWLYHLPPSASDVLVFVPALEKKKKKCACLTLFSPANDFCLQAHLSSARHHTKWFFCCHFYQQLCSWSLLILLIFFAVLWNFSLIKNHCRQLFPFPPYIPAWFSELFLIHHEQESITLNSLLNFESYLSHFTCACADETTRFSFPCWVGVFPIALNSLFFPPFK